MFVGNLRLPSATSRQLEGNMPLAIDNWIQNRTFRAYMLYVIIIYIRHFPKTPEQFVSGVARVMFDIQLNAMATVWRWELWCKRRRRPLLQNLNNLYSLCIWIVLLLKHEMSNSFQIHPLTDPGVRLKAEDCHTCGFAAMNNYECVRHSLFILTYFIISSYDCISSSCKNISSSGRCLQQWNGHVHLPVRGALLVV